MSFDRYLGDLTNPAAELVSAELFMLSRLDRESARELASVWPKITTERRRNIAIQASDIAEDDIEADFNDLFKVALRDEDSGVRALAVQGLWEYSGRDLVGPLIAMLEGDEDPGVRSTAALGLGRYVVRGEFDDLPAADKRRAEDALRHSYENAEEEIEVRARALESIGASSESFVEELIDEAHDSGNYRLRVSAIHAMGRNCDERWLPILFEEMTDEDAEVRFEAVGAAGLVADESAINAIADLLEDEDSEVKLAAIEALGHIGGRRATQHLRGLAKDENPAVQAALETAIDEASLELDPLKEQILPR